MKNFTYEPQGVCSRQITFTIDDEGKLHDVSFLGGCPGNLAAIGKLVEGADAKQIAGLLKGNLCGNRGTSCADQLSQAVTEALEKNGAA